MSEKLSKDFELGAEYILRYLKEFSPASTGMIDRYVFNDMVDEYALDTVLKELVSGGYIEAEKNGAYQGRWWRITNKGWQWL